MASVSESRVQAPEPARPAQIAAPASAAVASGAYTVQLTSQRSQEDAMTAFSNLQRRYASILGNYQPNLQPVNLGDRGTFYRVRVGSFASQADAQSLCANLKTAGGDCIVQRN
jgi:cell division septation protein DedD